MIERWWKEFLHALPIIADATPVKHLIGILEMKLKVGTSKISSEIRVTMGNVISRESDRGEIGNRRCTCTRSHVHTIIFEGELDSLHDARMCTW